MSTQDKITLTPYQPEGIDSGHDDPKQLSNVGDVLQDQGITRAEAVYRKATINYKTLWLVGVSTLVCA